MDLHYDRGTLLLSDTPPGWDYREFDGILWDPRVDAFRAPARLYRGLKTHFHKQGLALTDRAQQTFSSPLTSTSQKPNWRLSELRPYQLTAIERWEQAGKNGIIVLPTGAGKTVTAMSAMARVERALCIVPTRALLEQWRGQLAKHYAGPIGIQGDGLKTLESVTLSTYESAYRHIADFGNRFDLLVVDECHHFGVGMRDEILDMATAPQRLGLTATPATDPIALERISQLIGPTVFELSLGDLAGSYLSDFDYFRLQLDLTPRERACYELEMTLYRKVFLEFRSACPYGTYADWIRHASRTQEGRNALAAFRKAKKILGYCEEKGNLLGNLLKRHWNQKFLVFTSDTESAYHVSRRELIMPITAEISRKEREQTIARFRQGKLRGLVSCRVLNEGIDVPDAEVAIILGGQHGAREHIQRIGRTLRPVAGKRAQIYELVCRNTIETRQSNKRTEFL